MIDAYEARNDPDLQRPRMCRHREPCECGEDDANDRDQMPAEEPSNLDCHNAQAWYINAINALPDELTVLDIADDDLRNEVNGKRAEARAIFDGMLTA